MELKSIKILAIVQARLTSKRFPNKVLKKIKNKTLLQILLKRLKMSKKIDKIVVAIPKNKYQLKFWDWISRYYFTSIGEVMRASIPSNLILQSETVLTLNQDKEIEMGGLNDSEYLIVEALNINKQLSVKDVSEILETKNIF